MKAIGILTALLVVGMLAVSANAAIIISEHFDYPDGNLVPSLPAGWANHSGTGTFIQVVTGQAVLTHGSGSREDANISFTPNAGPKIFYGFDFSVDDLGVPYANDGTPDFEYFAHFRTGFAFAARLDIVAATGGGDFSVGISSDGSTADTIWGTDLTYGTTYRVVVGYDQVINQAQMWIDAVLETDTSILGNDQVAAGDVPDSFALRQSFSDANETIRIDNLHIGDNFSNVVVPEPATALLLGMGGLVLLRRRR